MSRPAAAPSAGAPTATRAGLIFTVVCAMSLAVPAALAAQETGPAPLAPPPEAAAGAAASRTTTATAAALAAGHELEGLASWYGMRFQGRLTANGETFDTNELTAAHKTLPFDTLVEVVNLDNARSVVVRINDRGPFVEGRVIDLSRAASDIIEMTGIGVAPVRIEVLHYQEPSDLRTLQLASFTQRPSAEATVARLTQAGFGAAIETVATLGVHRVIIQGVRERDIPSHRERLATLGFNSILVRQK